MERFLNEWILILTIIVGGILAAIFKKLTPSASATGCILACMVFAGGGYPGITIMAVFFIAGVLVTTWGANNKFKLGLAENKSGMRNTAQVLANAGAPAIAGLLHLLHIIPLSLSVLIIASCFSSAIADTVSSELGNVYGRKYYNILTLKKDKRGLNGVVSAEGFLFGLTGSLLIAAIYAFSFGWNINAVIIIVCGTAGNIIDSVLGATLETKGKLGNNAVNFLNTFFAGILAVALYTLSQS